MYFGFQEYNVMRSGSTIVIFVHNLVVSEILLVLPIVLCVNIILNIMWYIVTNFTFNKVLYITECRKRMGSVKGGIPVR